MINMRAVAFWVVLGCFTTGLKLTGLIDLPWVWVLLPFWLWPVVLVAAISLFAFIYNRGS